MFDVTESIEDAYLWNFTPHERVQFRSQHRSRQAGWRKYNAKLLEMIITDEKAIFANDEPTPSTSLEIKYTLNRIHLNDSRETELTLSHLDPASPEKAPYAAVLARAFEDNTYCQTVVLNGVQTREGWHTRGFNDDEADQILDVLQNKKLIEFTFASYPLLTDKTYLKIANMAISPDNQWEHVTLGRIPVAPDIADIYNRSGKVSYTRIEHQPIRRSFLSRLFHREMTNERN